MSLRAETMEVFVDFRRNRTSFHTVSILGEEAEVLEGYKYLGVLLDNRLDWKCYTGAGYRKGQTKHYFLRQLRPSMRAAICCNSFAGLL